MFVYLNVCLYNTFKPSSIISCLVMISYFPGGKKNIPALKTALNTDFLILHTPEVNVL